MQSASLACDAVSSTPQNLHSVTVGVSRSDWAGDTAGTERSRLRIMGSANHRISSTI
jgi:hypothetical protein